MFGCKDVWLRDFIPTFEKMMRSGYTNSELTTAPPSWANVLCLPKKGITCSIVWLPGTHWNTMENVGTQWNTNIFIEYAIGNGATQLLQLWQKEFTILALTQMIPKWIGPVILLALLSHHLKSVLNILHLNLCNLHACLCYWTLGFRFGGVRHGAVDLNSKLGHLNPFLSFLIQAKPVNEPEVRSL